MRESFESRIQKHIFILSDTEAEIVQYLRDHANTLGTIRDAAKDLYIVPNTLVRLAKKLGYAGWSEMKYDVIGGNGKRPSLESLLPTSSSTLTNLKMTVEHLDHRKIELLLKKIDGSETVVIYGGGGNKYYCEQLIRYLRIGAPSKHILYDTDFTVSQLTVNDTAIFLSYSGHTRKTEEMALLAKAKGAFTVSITSAGIEHNAVREATDMNFVYYNLDPPIINQNAPDLIGLLYIIREIASSYWRSKELV